MAQTLGTVGNSERSVQVLMYLCRTAGQGGAPAYWLNLQAQVLDTYRVVAVDGSFELQRENQIQIFTRPGHKRCATLRRRHLKARLELGDVLLTQKAIGRLQTADSPQPQLLGQAALPGAEVAFRPTPRLG